MIPLLKKEKLTLSQSTITVGLDKIISLFIKVFFGLVGAIFILKKFDNVEIESIHLPLKYRTGLTKWDGKNYDKNVEKACRLYPQDNDTEGFFVAKLKKIK